MNTFNTAVASHYSTIEICVKPSELEDKMLNQSHRGVENLAMRSIDTNPALLNDLREKGEEEKREARTHELHQLNVRHRAYVADTRKALAYCFSKRALYVLIMKWPIMTKLWKPKPEESSVTPLPSWNGRSSVSRIVFRVKLCHLL